MSGALDVELAVLVLGEALGPGHDHAADGVGPHDVAVVIDLDPLGRRLQPEHLADALASSLAWAEPSAMRRPRASRALVRAWSTRRLFSPRLGTAISTLRPLLMPKASASSSALGDAVAEARSGAGSACPRRTGPGRRRGCRRSSSLTCRRAGK